MIPKIVHHIWIQGASRCPFRDNIRACQQGSEHIRFFLWDDSTIRPLFQEIDQGRVLEKIYDQEPTPAGRSDIARYMILYLFGGYYLDTDYRCVRPLSLWIDQLSPGADMVIVHTADLSYRVRRAFHKHFVINGLFGASEKSPVLRCCLETIARRDGHGSMAEKTGTVLFGACIQDLMKETPEKIAVLPVSYFHPVTMFRSTDDTSFPLMIHENTMSWGSSSQKSIQRFMHKMHATAYRWTAVFLVFIVIVVVLMSLGQWLAAGISALVFMVLGLVGYGLIQGRFAIPPRFPYRSVVSETKKSGASRLMIVCHPDDEILFGGLAILRHDGWKVVCLACGGDERRSAEFVALMKHLDHIWEYEIWDHDDQGLARALHPAVKTRLRRILSENDYKTVLSHNYKGEYGHPQHRLVGALVSRLVPTGLWVFWDTQGCYGTGSADEAETLTGLIQRFYPSQARKITKHIQRASRYWMLRVA